MCVVIVVGLGDVIVGFVVNVDVVVGVVEIFIIEDDDVVVDRDNDVVVGDD